MRQVVFNDVLIVGRFDVDGQSFAPIGLHKTDAASDWLLIKRHCTGMEGLPGGSSEKFKNQPRPLLRPRSVNFRQHCRNLSHETVPLNFTNCREKCESIPEDRNH